MDGVPSWLFDWLTKHLTDSQLQALHAHVYDRFTWETGDKQDAHLRDALEDERSRREDAFADKAGGTLTFRSIVPGNGIIILDDAMNGDITITIDPDYKPEHEVSVVDSGLVRHGQI